MLLYFTALVKIKSNNRIGRVSSSREYDFVWYVCQTTRRTLKYYYMFDADVLCMWN